MREELEWHVLEDGHIDDDLLPATGFPVKEGGEISRSMCIQNTAMVMRDLVKAGRLTLKRLNIRDAETKTPEKLAEMMYFAPGGTDDWARSAARGAARIAMTLMMAHYGNFISLKEMASFMPTEDEKGNKIDEDACHIATYGYDAKVANLVTLDNWYKECPLPASPDKGQCSENNASEADAAKEPEAEPSDKAAPESPAQ